MRTTVTLDPDVDSLLRQRMRERRLTFKEALNHTLRAALSAAVSETGRPFTQQTFSMGFDPRINLDKASHLAAEDEDREIARKLDLRK